MYLGFSSFLVEFVFIIKITKINAFCSHNLVLPIFSPRWGYTVFDLKHPPLPPSQVSKQPTAMKYSRIFRAWGLGVLLVFFVERRKLRDASENGTKRAIDIVLA